MTEIARVRTDKRAAGLCHALGYHLHMIGAYAEARLYFKRALTIREQALGLDHPDTQTARDNLAALDLEIKQ